MTGAVLADQNNVPVQQMLNAINSKIKIFNVVVIFGSVTVIG